MTDQEAAQALLVADLVLRSPSLPRQPLFGLNVVADERMPRGCWALGSREGAIVVHDVDDFKGLLARRELT